MLNEIYSPTHMWHPLNIYNPTNHDRSDPEPPAIACLKPKHQGVVRTVKGLEKRLEPKTEISSGMTIGVVMAAALVMAFLLPVVSPKFQK
ncbi:hypothetical protein [Mesorhizobium sp. SP-1A]|uniref:hypothetical protein n=1 Tax=Mesorhizobium sp. SP-1A TaxID=3077840 RepID=UPI0028F6D448|nr:hypothetical protein [Mesorhizobium sp. SP-1A]